VLFSVIVGYCRRSGIKVRLSLRLMITVNRANEMDITLRQFVVNRAWAYILLDLKIQVEICRKAF
jgi:hypothetical protein